VREPRWRRAKRAFLLAWRLGSARSVTVGAILLSLVSVLATLWPSLWWLAPAMVGTALALSQVIRQVHSGWQVRYTDFWRNWSGARPWLRRTLGRLSEEGIGSITVMGVAATDIAFLFDEVVTALSRGVDFDILTISARETTLLRILKEFEGGPEVRRVVQLPIAEELGNRIRVWESQDRNGLAKQIRKLRARLEAEGYTDHATCIQVCEELWMVAQQEAASREAEAGSVTIYHQAQLPFTRQWIIGDRAIIFSVYVGHPGVGTDDAVFCYSTLDGFARGAGAIAKRAKQYVDELKISGCTKAREGTQQDSSKEDGASEEPAAGREGPTEDPEN
jgi:hypothetical protein